MSIYDLALKCCEGPFEHFKAELKQSRELASLAMTALKSEVKRESATTPKKHADNKTVFTSGTWDLNLLPDILGPAVEVADKRFQVITMKDGDTCQYSLAGQLSHYAF